MNDKILQKIINYFKEEMMTTGSSTGVPGFSDMSNPGGPTAGRTPILDGRGRLARRLPREYRKSLSKGKNRKKD